MATVKAVIGEVRFSYLHVFEPYAAKEGERRNYSAVLLIPKSNKALVEQVKKAIKEAYNVAVTEKWGGKTPKDGYWFNPLQDGDEPKSDGEDRGDDQEQGKPAVGLHGADSISVTRRGQAVASARRASSRRSRRRP